MIIDSQLITFQAQLRNVRFGFFGTSVWGISIVDGDSASSGTTFPATPVQPVPLASPRDIRTHRQLVDGRRIHPTLVKGR